MSPSATAHSNQCDAKYVTFGELLHAPFMADTTSRGFAWTSLDHRVRSRCKTFLGYDFALFFPPNRNVFRAYWSLATAWSLLVQHCMENNAQYDAVVLARPDVWFHVDTDLPKWVKSYWYYYRYCFCYRRCCWYCYCCFSRLLLLLSL